MLKRSGGFTLVELLVVIGILGVLMALLLPAMSAAKRQAQTVLCIATLREVSTATLLVGQDHQGFLPLSGEIIVPNAPRYRGSNAYPRLLNDPFRRRYTYATNTENSAYTLVPLPGVLAPYMGVRNLPFDDWDALDQRLNDLAIRQHFSCPATDALDRGRYSTDPHDTTLVGQGSMVIFATESHVFLSGWATNSDYAINEGIMGFHPDTRYADRRLRGNINGLVHSDRVVLFGDALPRAAVAYSFCPWICWTPSLTSTGPVTLADALDNNGQALDASMFDARRHGGRMNIAFADGHVATLSINHNELQYAFLLSR